MAVEYKETEMPPGDTRGQVLEQLAGTQLWALVCMDLTEDEDTGEVSMNLRVEQGTMVRDVETLRAILTRTLAALPADV